MREERVARGGSQPVWGHQAPTLTGEPLCYNHTPPAHSQLRSPSVGISLFSTETHLDWTSLSHLPTPPTNQWRIFWQMVAKETAAGTGCDTLQILWSSVCWFQCLKFRSAQNKLRRM